LTALIEADFRSVDLHVGPPNESHATCAKHALEKCSDCHLDFVNLNRLSKLLLANPTLLCPPPANVVSQRLSQVINTTKEEGNALFKMGKHRDALGRYTMAASIAIQRPPWEANQFMREELSTVISNRSAAFFEAGDFIGALIDAETVISLRRNWSKGHFRRAKALVGLRQYGEAKEALRLGLQFEPLNVELNGYLDEIDKAAKAASVALRGKSEKPIDSIAA
jgi:translocation protein SEC72